MPGTISQTKPRIKVVVARELCGYCGACVAVCTSDAMFLFDTYLHIDEEACSACERCARACPMRALSLVERTDGAGE